MIKKTLDFLFPKELTQEEISWVINYARYCLKEPNERYWKELLITLYGSRDPINSEGLILPDIIEPNLSSVLLYITTYNRSGQRALKLAKKMGEPYQLLKKKKEETKE